jgi:hypothetical protein
MLIKKNKRKKEEEERLMYVDLSLLERAGQLSSDKSLPADYYTKQIIIVKTSITTSLIIFVIISLNFKKCQFNILIHLSTFFNFNLPLRFFAKS